MLILCGLMTGVLGMSASAAQAEVGAVLWVLKEGKLINLSVVVQTKNETTGTLLTKISGVSVEFNCTETELKKAKYTGTNGTFEKGATVKFTGCTTKLNGTTTAACEPTNAGTEKGVIVTKGLHGLVRLHLLSKEPLVDDDIIEVLPDEGETFATIEMGKECSIGTKVPVIGPKFSFKDCKNEFLVHKVEHLLEEFGPLTELWAISKTAEHKATIDGSVWAFLIEEHKGLPWSIEPK